MKKSNSKIHKKYKSKKSFDQLGNVKPIDKSFDELFPNVKPISFDQQFPNVKPIDKPFDELFPNVKPIDKSFDQQFPNSKPISFDDLFPNVKPIDKPFDELFQYGGVYKNKFKCPICNKYFYIKHIPDHYLTH